MIGISLILTEKCDWDCHYCMFPFLSCRNETNETILQRHLPYIADIIYKLRMNQITVNLDIQGGEVGLLPPNVLREFFQIMKMPVAVSTNGEFLKQGYHLDEDIQPYISTILWHVTNDFSAVVEDYEDDKTPISRGIVHDDIFEIMEFIRNNQHIMFDYVEFEFDIKEARQMKVDMYHVLIEMLKQVKNITDNVIHRLEARIFENPKNRDNCRDLNSSVVLDMVNETICLCQRNTMDNIPLTEDKLRLRLKGFPRNFFKGDGCETCTRLHSAKMAGTSIESIMKVRRVLK